MVCISVLGGMLYTTWGWPALLWNIALKLSSYTRRATRIPVVEIAFAGTVMDGSCVIASVAEFDVMSESEVPRKALESDAEMAGVHEEHASVKAAKNAQFLDPMDVKLLNASDRTTTGRIAFAQKTRND
ncbi:hypothetical protein F4777DRAFT_481463 [Nemania sp. FL0916]|nr:hypothetical protein F4777DRAFT_481463 [Nemania sp. FL0916]